MDDRVAAYIAGIVDGEGHLGWVRKQVRPYPIIRVVMNHRPTIEWIASHLDEPVNQWRQGEREPGWRVQINGTRAIVLLNEIRPYLLTKAAEADEMLLWKPSRAGTTRRGIADAARRTTVSRS